MAERAATTEGRWTAPNLAGSGARLVPGRPGAQLLPAWPANWDGSAPAYLAHLLRAVLTGPGADAEGVASRMAAELLVALAELGAGGDAAWAMATRPGAVAVYEVRSFASGSLDPADPFGTADPGEAILEARDRGREAGRSVELLSRDEGGLQRCVLTQTSAGLRYRFPEFACLDAPGVGGGVIAVAVEEWRAALQPVAPPAAPVAPVAVPSAQRVAEATLELLVEDGRALRTYDVADVLASLIPTAGDVADLVVERLVAHFEGRDAAAED